MLERPPSRQAVRKARYRERQRRGVMCVRVEVSALGLELLVRTRWLAEVEAADLDAIGRAIGALLEDSGRRK